MEIFERGPESLRFPIVITTLALALFLACPSNTAAQPLEQVCDVGADYALAMEDYPETIRLHRRLIATRPNGALARYHLGFALGMVGHRGEEIRQYLAAARLGLNQWDLFLNLGLAYLDQGKLEKAVDALETAARLGPDRVEAHFNLAIAYERSGRLRQALKEISQSLRLSPGDPDARDVRAIIAAELQDYGRAPVESADLVRTEPSHMPAR